MSRIALAVATAFCATSAHALSVEVENIHQGDPIPMKHALCEATPEGKSTAGENLRPTIRWSGEPANTKSFAVIVTDPDVPADFSKAGKDGMVVPQDAKRQMFYHWALVDIPAETHSITGGPSKENPEFGQAAANSLGSYLPNPLHYGGPCPPWNDARIHHYHFTVYALNVGSLALSSKATAAEAEKAAKAHALAHAEVVGTYTLNPQRMQ